MEARGQKSGTRTAEISVAAMGLLCAATGLLSRQAWLDAHMMPSFFLPHAWYVTAESGVRAALVAIGAGIVLVRRPLARACASRPSMLVSVAVAIVLALAASEFTLRHLRLRPAEWLRPAEEPLRVVDPRLGWTLARSRAAMVTVGDRTVEYAMDRSGYRVRDVSDPVDPDRPSIVFIGESMMFGEGLACDETVPAQVARGLGIQGANLGVHGYSTDQAYLHLEAELPHFHHPVAVVTLFMTALFGRNLDDDRPHLDPGLIWRPAVAHSRLQSLAKLLVPFRRERTVERGIMTTREVLRATADLARAHGAPMLILVPQVGAESAVERDLRRRVLDDLGLPFVVVDLDAAWLLPGNLHPDAHAAGVMAAAVAGRLRPLVAAVRSGQALRRSSGQAGNPL